MNHAALLGFICMYSDPVVKTLMSNHIITLSAVLQLLLSQKANEKKQKSRDVTIQLRDLSVRSWRLMSHILADGTDANVLSVCFSEGGAAEGKQFRPRR